MYEMRIKDKYTFGNSTYTTKTLNELHAILKSLIISNEAEIKIYEVKEINKSWINECERYSPVNYDLTVSEDRELYYAACIQKSNLKEKNK